MEWTRKTVEGLICAWSLEPCLFHVKHGLYHNKHARKEAMLRVTEKVKELGGPKTTVDIQNKMKSLRTTYVHELNKKLKSKRSGVGLLDVYQPSVWYFDKMDFLQEHVQPRKSVTNFEGPCSSDSTNNLDISDTQLLEVTFNNEDIQDANEELMIAGDSDISLPISPSILQSPSASSNGRRKKKKLEDKEDCVLEKAYAVLEKISVERTPMSAWDTFGQYVATTLKRVNDRKLQLKAKRAILTVLMDIEEEDAEGK